jgi:hypothetical protein
MVRDVRLTIQQSTRAEGCDLEALDAAVVKARRS